MSGGLRKAARALRLSVQRDGALRTAAGVSMYVLSGEAFRDQAYRRSVQQVEKEQPFDAIYGVDTSAPEALFTLESVHRRALHHEGYNPYSTSAVSIVKAALAAVPVDHADYTFIDVGSGKGRSLLLASEYRYQRIIGVEFASELCDVARKNAARFAEATGRPVNVELVWCDADEYTFPPGNLVLYLFNPFGFSPFARMIKRIIDSRTPDAPHVWLVYIRPLFTALLTDLARFELVHASCDEDELLRASMTSDLRTVPWAIFRTNAMTHRP